MRDKMMLWLDGEKSLSERIVDAAQHFEKKYGKLPNFVKVPDTIDNVVLEELNEPDNISVVKSRYLQEPYIKVGVKE